MIGIADYIKDLNSEDEKKRAFAAEDIAYEGLIEGIPSLVERLQVETSRFVKEAIVNSLKSMNSDDLVGNLIPLLRSDDAFIRNATIDILSAQGESAVEPIRKLLFDSDKDVRKFALDVIMQLNNSYAKDLIADALNDSDANIVITAVEYLGRLEAYDYAPRINTLLPKTSNVLLRCTCLETLAVIGDEESIACVAAVYPQRHLISPLELYSYLKFIAYRGTDADLPLLIDLMRDKGQLMHKEIINALEGILYRSHWDKLEQELLMALIAYMETDINDINKYELLVLMGSYKNKEIFPFLIEHTKSNIKLISQGAAEGLGKYGDGSAKSVLNGLKDRVRDEELLEAIERALEQLDNEVI